MEIIDELKQIPIIKKMRKARWKHYARRFLLPSWKLKKLKKGYQKDNKIFANHLIKNLNQAKKIEKEVQKVIHTRKIECDAEKLINDILFWYFVYGFSVNEYFCYNFLSKTAQERHTYVSDREIIMFGYEVNDIDKMQILSDKILTYKMFKDYYRRDAICINKKDDFYLFVEFVEKHPKFVKKEVREACGRSVELIDMTNMEDIDESNLFNFLISRGKTILEEPIIQNSKMSRLNSSSVNTIRCITLLDNDEIKIPYCFAKIGRQGAFIDNGAAGGILVGIDCKSGIFVTDGIDELGRRYKMHPDSGIELIGFQVPEWKQMKKLCKEMSKKIPSVKFIGWDMAYSEKGWVVVEGNSLSEAIGPQSTFGKGIRADLVKYLGACYIPEDKVFCYAD